MAASFRTGVGWFRTAIGQRENRRANQTMDCAEREEGYPVRWMVLASDLSPIWDNNRVVPGRNSLNVNGTPSKINRATMLNDGSFPRFLLHSRRPAFATSAHPLRARLSRLDRGSQSQKQSSALLRK
jgi:hypothetical protein